MTGILQPDGTMCYTGAGCRRHGQYSRVMQDRWKIYFDYKAQQLEKNWLTFPYNNNINTIPDYVLKRIEEWAVRNETTYEWALKLALNDKDGWKVVVHPEVRRQSWQEEALFGYLSKFKPTYFNEAKILPKSKTATEDALTLKNGELLKNVKNVKAQDGSKLKTLDGYVEIANTNRRVYIITKYTEGKGGSQDNQANEALRSLKEQRADNNFIVAAIVDGDYYEATDRTRKTWIERNRDGLPENAFLGSHKDFLQEITNGTLF